MVEPGGGEGPCMKAAHRGSTLRTGLVGAPGVRRWVLWGHWGRLSPVSGKADMQAILGRCNGQLLTLLHALRGG